MIGLGNTNTASVWRTSDPEYAEPPHWWQSKATALGDTSVSLPLCQPQIPHKTSFTLCKIGQKIEEKEDEGWVGGGGTVRYVGVQVVLNASADSSVFFIDRPHKKISGRIIGTLNPEDEHSTIVRNVGKYAHNDTAAPCISLPTIHFTW